MVEELGAGIAVRAADLGEGELHGLTAADVPRVQTGIETVLANHTYASAAQGVARQLAGRPMIPEILQGLRTAEAL
jgi:hypothetical protein